MVALVGTWHVRIRVASVAGYHLDIDIEYDLDLPPPSNSHHQGNSMFGREPL